MPVRSACLASGNSAPHGTLKTVLTVPSGQTYLVKDIRVSETSGAGCRAVVQAVSGAAAVHVVEEALGGLEAASTQGFIVLEPGDQMKVFADHAGFVFWISGAILDGVA